MNQRGSGEKELGPRELARQDTRVGSNGARAGAGLIPPFADAAERWLRRGYRVQFADRHLAQLGAPVAGPERRDIAIAVALGAAGALLGALGWLAYLHLTRRGRWHEVSLTLTPERGVLTYERYLPIPMSEPASSTEAGLGLG